MDRSKARVFKVSSKKPFLFCPSVVFFCNGRNECDLENGFSLAQLILPPSFCPCLTFSSTFHVFNQGLSFIVELYNKDAVTKIA